VFHVVEIYPLTFTKRDLASVPRDEILFHTIFAQVSNEILILRKQVMLASNSIGEPGAKTDAAVATAHVNLRLLAGRIFEASELLRGEPAGLIYKAYLPDLDATAIEAHRSIMKYFGKPKNLIRKIRNKASFHWDYETLVKAFDEIPDDLSLTDYINLERGNALYYSGALLSMGQVAAIADLHNVGEAMDRLHNDVTEVGSWFASYAEGIMVAFAMRHLSLSEELFTSIRQTLPDCPDIQAATTPYFLDTESIQHLRLPEVDAPAT
jgi:hypothetical protein